MPLGCWIWTASEPLSRDLVDLWLLVHLLLVYGGCFFTTDEKGLVLRMCCGRDGGKLVCFGCHAVKLSCRIFYSNLYVRCFDRTLISEGFWTTCVIWDWYRGASCEPCKLLVGFAQISNQLWYDSYFSLFLPRVEKSLLVFRVVNCRSNWVSSLDFA